MSFESNHVKRFFQQHSAFFLPYLIFLLCVAYILLIFDKSEIHLFFNQYHNPFLDTVFYYITFLGDGITAFSVSFIFLFINKRHALFIFLSNAVASLLAQYLKHYIFPDMDRPKLFFQHLKALYLVPGVDNASYNSFPSGHATTAFATSLCLALILQNKVLKFSFFCIAILIGFSRIYLSQHFISDVYAGSILGVSVTCIFYWIIYEKFPSKLRP